MCANFPCDELPHNAISSSVSKLWKITILHKASLIMKAFEGDKSLDVDMTRANNESDPRNRQQKAQSSVYYSHRK